MNCLILLHHKSFLLNLLTIIVASFENYYCLNRLNKYPVMVTGHLKNSVDVVFFKSSIF